MQIISINYTKPYNQNRLLSASGSKHLKIAFLNESVSQLVLQRFFPSQTIIARVPILFGFCQRGDEELESHDKLGMRGIDGELGVKSRGRLSLSLNSSRCVPDVRESLP